MGKQALAIRIQGSIFYGALILLKKTWKIEIEGRQNLDKLYAEDKHCLLCFWHGKYIPIFPLLEGYDACVITNKSERGNVISEICRKFGFYNAQIPDEANRNSYNLMREAIAAKAIAGTAADGPLGPACQVKSGVVRISSALGYSLLPVSVGIRHKIVLKGRWDHREIPLPFSKVCMIFGTPIELPPNLRSSQVRIWEERTAIEISALSELAETKVAKHKGRKTDGSTERQIS
jgi:lysophospholipid acyltransferase (LPLAT)-like uncharacterized protein